MAICNAIQCNAVPFVNSNLQCNAVKYGWWEGRGRAYAWVGSHTACADQMKQADHQHLEASIHSIRKYLELFAGTVS